MNDQPDMTCTDISVIMKSSTHQRRLIFQAKCGLDDPRQCRVHYAKAFGRSEPGGPFGYVTAAQVLPMRARSSSAHVARATPSIDRPTAPPPADPIAESWGVAEDRLLS